MRLQRAEPLGDRGRAHHVDEEEEAALGEGPAALAEQKRPERAVADEQARSRALIVKNNSLTYEHRAAISETSKRLRIPDMYEARELVAAGGLVSYGPIGTELYRQAAGYFERILKGAKPADIPVQQPTKLDLVLNLKTAKAIASRFPNRCCCWRTRSFSRRTAPAIGCLRLDSFHRSRSA